MPVKTVAPVVVKPENASNTESAKERLGVCKKISGKDAKDPSTSQNNTTIKKPSRAFKSPF